MLLDQLRINNCEQWLRSNNYEITPFYLNTEWSFQIKNSPFFITLEQSDILWKRWEEDPNWASSAIIYQLEDENLAETLQEQLRKNITIKSQSGKLWLCRFYSPNVWMSLSKSLTQEQLQTLSGCADAIYLSPSLLHDNHPLIQLNDPVTTFNQLSVSDTIIEGLIA
ncbi:uncharacterized protein DUF4123 [Celerinatantimonas diazotrophica]|uniref:Uncharacterized protein DUF4123 n=2 Tax=Celerinatantimonas diazotrophica TaxID=412034 RepID=A0A4R1KDP9_9GAMM|nr:uncharacterized protein DUF4123 [Celerinatantimonas diazotrophica]CAG9298331.1 hypothetical protein CEDIAZO_03531 [Celerinatantimonas diazotrophica]